MSGVNTLNRLSLPNVNLPEDPLGRIGQTLLNLSLVSPDRSDLDRFAPVHRSKLGVRQHVIEGRNQFIDKPLAELGVRHPVMPNNRKLLLFDKAPGCPVYKLIQDV